MKLGAWFGEHWPYLLGAVGLGSVVAVAIATAPKVGPAADFIPPLPPPPPGGAPALRWIELEAPYRLFTGDVYRACVDIPFGTGFLVTPAKIVEGATKMGFRDVKVSTSIPSGWPGKDDCDRFVEATWNADDRIEPANSHITHAWRLTRA